MSIRVEIPPPMRDQSGCLASVPVSGSNVKALIDDLVRQHPGLNSNLFDGGKLRPHVNVLVNDEDIRYLDDLDTAVTDGVVVALIPAVAGG